LLLANPVSLSRVYTMSMMPPGGIRYIGWRLIHPSAWKGNSKKFRFMILYIRL
jgi:hypothetical protein